MAPNMKDHVDALARMAPNDMKDYVDALARLAEVTRQLRVARAVIAKMHDPSDFNAYRANDNGDGTGHVDVDFVIDTYRKHLPSDL